eukprot:3577961-Alexandrium_andersonii.AAC.1
MPKHVVQVRSWVAAFRTSRAIHHQSLVFLMLCPDAPGLQRTQQVTISVRPAGRHTQRKTPIDCR